MTDKRRSSPEPEVLPTPRLSLDEEHIEHGESTRGIAQERAASADTLAESLAHVAETDVLQYRLTQQAILSDFGLEALRCRSIGELQQQATAMCAEGMRAKFCKLLRYLADEGKLLVCAGVGWEPGTVGKARVGADCESPAGYAFRTGNPVISNHLDKEKRFRTPTMMADHGVQRAINVLIVANGEPWGVLEVDSPEGGQFDVADVPFLQGFANLIGVALERSRAEEELRELLDHQRLLVRESSHRTKNSLALVTSLLHLQARDAQNEAVTVALEEAASRIQTIGSAHDLLWRSDVAGRINVGSLLNDLVAQLREQAPGLQFNVKTDGVTLDSDRAIAVGLLVTEIVTNAAKHAYEDGRGSIDLACRCVGGERYSVAIRDYGKGLPEGFSLTSPDMQSLGVRMMRSLVRQLRGEIEVRTDGGAIFEVIAPLKS